MSNDLNKFVKKMRIWSNKDKGKSFEDSYKAVRQLQGYEVERTGRGHDFVERKITQNPWTGKVKKGPRTYIETKSSSTAPLSKLQKKTKKKTRNYKVVRPSW